MDPLMVGLRIAHIGAGVLWVGAAWTMFFFVFPTLRALGPETQANFMEVATRRRKLTAVILAATVVTVTAGAILYWIDSDGLSAAWFQSGFGIGITIGAVAAIAAFLLGPLAIVPTLKRLEDGGAAIGPSGPTPDQAAQMATFGRRLDRIFLLDTSLLGIAVLFMAISRYL
jgi:uncharacterized membrane protein